MFWQSRPNFYIFIFFGLVLGLAAGYASIGGLPGSKMPNKGAEPQKSPVAHADETQGQDPPPVSVRVAPYTTLIFQYEHTGCEGQSQISSRAAGKDLAGLDREGLQAKFPEWHIEVFRPAQVILKRQKDGPCRKDMEYRTIGVKDNRVVVFVGKPGNLGPMLRDTGIEISRLLPADQEKLKQGIVVRSEEEVWLFLEGLE